MILSQRRWFDECADYSVKMFLFFSVLQLVLPKRYGQGKAFYFSIAELDRYNIALFAGNHTVAELGVFHQIARNKFRTRHLNLLPLRRG